MKNKLAFDPGGCVGLRSSFPHHFEVHTVVIRLLLVSRRYVCLGAKTLELIIQIQAKSRESTLQ